jgi:hypothetical protein
MGRLELRVKEAPGEIQIPALPLMSETAVAVAVRVLLVQMGQIQRLVVQEETESPHLLQVHP